MASGLKNLLKERPEILGRYRSLEVRGAGAFGTVEVAWDKTLHRRVAIKHIVLPATDSKAPAGDAATASLAIQEARTAANLNDPHIATVLDFEQTDSEALIIMENVEGVTLSELMRSQTELLDLDVAAVIIDGVARALICAHKHGVLHLDIKPDNILISHDGTVKVTDFGLARLVGQALSACAPRGGTIGYMPPEQIELGELDARTDIWALAALSYTLITGINPFLAVEPKESLALIVGQDYDLPTSFNVELGNQCDEILAQSLSPDPSDRPDTVAEFYNVLKPCLGGLKTGKRELRLIMAELGDGQADDGTNAGTDLIDDGGLDDGGLDDGEDADETTLDQAREEAPLQLPLFERLSGRTQAVLLRLIAFVGAATMAWLGMSALALLGASYSADPTGLSESISQFATLPTDAQALAQGATALAVGLVALLAPSLGIVLALATICFAVFVMLGVLPGIALALLCIAWWVFVGRVSKAGAITTSLVPLGMALMVPSVPVQLTGYFLSLKQVLPTAVFSFALALAVAVITGADHLGAVALVAQNNILHTPLELLFSLAVSPLLWLTGLAWIAASVLVHAFARFGTRLLAFVGVMLANAAQLAVLVLLPTLLNIEIGAAQLLPQSLLVGTSFVLMAIICIVGITPYDPKASQTDA